MYFLIYYFKVMPLPKPRSGQDQKDFMTECMNDDLMKREYPNRDQRLAVCAVQWRKSL
jgi:hypothetical protein